MTEEVSRAIRYKHDLTIFIMDLDNFRLVNTEYGHPVGDKVLKKIAAIIKKSFRDVDIVGRIGGEEFGVILPETSKDKALELARRLSKKIKESILTDLKEDGVELQKTISIGISSFNGLEHGKENAVDLSKKLYEEADKNLYILKGKNGKGEPDNRGKIAMGGEVIQP
jgi:diguanylate cyclase (GGDEF)-like protein